MVLHEGTILVLGRQSDGGWSAMDASGGQVERFATFEAARNHAEQIRRERPGLLIASSRGATPAADVTDGR